MLYKCKRCTAVFTYRNHSFFMRNKFKTAAQNLNTQLFPKNIIWCNTFKETKAQWIQVGMRITLIQRLVCLNMCLIWEAFKVEESYSKMFTFQFPLLEQVEIYIMAEGSKWTANSHGYWLSNVLVFVHILCTFGLA